MLRGKNLTTEGVGNGGGFQFGREEEGEQRAADTAKPNWMKQAVLLLTSPKVVWASGGEPVRNRTFSAFSSLLCF